MAQRTSFQGTLRLKSVCLQAKKHNITIYLQVYKSFLLYLQAIRS